MPTPEAHADARMREAAFVAATIQRCLEDKGLAARLRRADNPATEYQSWDWLATWNVALEYPDQRLPYAVVAAAIARAKPDANGKLSLGEAIAMCYEDGNASDQAKARLRRLLACDEVGEVCRILRPLLTLIESRVGRPLDYTRLLRELRLFPTTGERIKARWAQAFYRKSIDAEATP